jgi:hypothetical protein
MAKNLATWSKTRHSRGWLEAPALLLPRERNNPFLYPKARKKNVPVGKAGLPPDAEWLLANWHGNRLAARVCLPTSPPSDVVQALLLCVLPLITPTTDFVRTQRRLSPQSVGLSVASPGTSHFRACKLLGSVGEAKRNT